LNLRPPAPKAGALPGCATPRPKIAPEYTRARMAPVTPYRNTAGEAACISSSRKRLPKVANSSGSALQM
jgi:hypothetical protein